MIHPLGLSAIFFLASTGGLGLGQSEPLGGAAAFGDWRSDRPGLSRIIRPDDLPKPGATPSVANFPHVIQRPPNAVPQVPAGFKVDLFADGLTGPRELRVAPNGDIFIAETHAGRVRVLRAADGASRPSANEIFASGLNQPFGIAFFPSGNNPLWVYIANTDGVVRFHYASGDLKASGKAEVVVAGLPSGGSHSTRNCSFTPDDRRMLVSVGSRSNAAEGLGTLIGALQSWSGKYPLGASLGTETDCAAVLEFSIRTEIVLERSPRAFAIAWVLRCILRAGTCIVRTNERDGLGDDLVPDYITRVREGAFYGWPWFYIGDNQDPRHAGERADLKGKISCARCPYPGPFRVTGIGVLQR